MPDLFTDIEKGVEIGQKGLNIIDKLIGPLLGPKEEARQYAIEVIKRDKTLSATDEQIVAFILNSNRYIKNLNSVLKKTAPLINPKVTYSIDEDWANYYLDKAKFVSSDDFQDLWAKILAEEINQKNSISKKMLNTLSMMDSQTARAFTNLCRLAVDYTEFIYDFDENTIKRNGIKPFLIDQRVVNSIIDKLQARGLYSRKDNVFDEYSEIYNEIESFDEILEDLGLIRFSREQSMLLPSSESTRKRYGIEISYDHKQYFFSNYISERQIINNEAKNIISQFEFTHSGKQLLHFINYKPVFELPMLLHEHMLSWGYTMTIQ